MRGHPVPGAPVDDQRLARAEPLRCARRVHRGVAAAVHRDPPPEHRVPARRDLAQERDRVNDPACLPRRDVHVLGQVRADRDEGGVEPGALRVQVRHWVPARDPHAHGLDPADLRGEHVAGQPVGGDAVPHHPAGLGARVPHLHLVPAPGQVVCGGQPARAGPDDEHPLAGRLGLLHAQRPVVARGQVAEEPFHGVDGDGAVQFGAVAHGLARVIADPPVDGRERVVVGEQPPGALEFPVARGGQPGLDVLACRAAGVARRQQVHVYRPASTRGPGQAGVLHQVRHWGQIMHGHTMHPAVPRT
jgi:hypothetical protein